MWPLNVYPDFLILGVAFSRISALTSPQAPSLVIHKDKIAILSFHLSASRLSRCAASLGSSSKSFEWDELSSGAPPSFFDPIFRSVANHFRKPPGWSAWEGVRLY